MIEPESLEALQAAVQGCIDGDSSVLERMRMEVRSLRARTRRIHPRSATAISLVGTDGGNNQLRFDPFMIQLIRVVDSSNNEYCLEVITPNTSIEALNQRHLDSEGRGMTALGKLMEYLAVDSLHKLSPTLSLNPDRRSPSWVAVYREIMEWAILFSLVREANFGTDTIVVCDGLLRSKVFAKELFGKLRQGLEEGIKRQFERNRRRIYIAGIAKRSKVLQAYRLAMVVEGVLRNAYPCYVEVPEQLEVSVYRWPEYAGLGGEGEWFAAGRMFFVKFGGSRHDPIWAIDLLRSQVDDAAVIFGHLLADSVDGFPVPFYPQCLQRAHERAALVDFDFDILQDQISEALRAHLSDKRWVIDELALQETDPSHHRYE
jgi:hypothetical protein